MMIDSWSAERTLERSDDLGKLLCDAVNGGASLGFLAPIDREHAWAHWVEVSRRVARGAVHVLVAEHGGELIGSVQLHEVHEVHEAEGGGASHRAQVCGLMVRSLFRQRGHGRQLMQAVQALAHARGRTTLTLDTRLGDRSERLFHALGWVKSGEVPQHARGADGALVTASLYHLVMA